MTDAKIQHLPVAERAPVIARGVCRLLASAGCSSVLEMRLPDGRRADVVAMLPDGSIHIVEIKSSIVDFPHRSEMARLSRVLRQSIISRSTSPPRRKSSRTRSASSSLTATAHRSSGAAPSTASRPRAERPSCCGLRRLPPTGFWRSMIRCSGRRSEGSQRGARLARMRCNVRRCMLRRRAVSETLRPHNS